MDGAVSFILEWNGLTFVYGSDTIPNKWYIEHSKGADVAVHECFLPPNLLIVTKQGFAPLGSAQRRYPGPHLAGAVRQGHVAREAAPRPWAIHFYNDFDTEPYVRDRVRKTYDGPLALATGLHGLQRHQGR